MTEHITSLKNQKVTTWKSLKERKGRRETGCFLVEGRKMVEEALASAFTVEAVLVDADRMGEFSLPGNVPVYTMPGHVLAAVCVKKFTYRAYVSLAGNKGSSNEVYAVLYAEK